MSSVGLHPLISLPTRINLNSATLIDNIFTNSISVPISSGILFTSLSDHLPVFAILGNSEASDYEGPQYVLKRKITEQGKVKYGEMIKQWSHNFVPQVESVEDDAANFRNQVRDMYDICFPQKKVKVNVKDIHKPWLCDDGFIAMVREKIDSMDSFSDVKLNAQIQIGRG